MLRVYSPTGADVLMANAQGVGGHVDCLGADTAGGCFAILGNADPGQIAFIQSLGVTVLPTSLSAVVPTAIPSAAWNNTLPAPVTVNDLMTIIYSNAPLPSWHPDFT